MVFATWDSQKLIRVHYKMKIKEVMMMRPVVSMQMRHS